jgi:hypothetical protein
MKFTMIMFQLQLCLTTVLSYRLRRMFQRSTAEKRHTYWLFQPWNDPVDHNDGQRAVYRLKHSREHSKWDGDRTCLARQYACTKLVVRRRLAHSHNILICLALTIIFGAGLGVCLGTLPLALVAGLLDLVLC